MFIYLYILYIYVNIYTNININIYICIYMFFNNSAGISVDCIALFSCNIIRNHYISSQFKPHGPW